MTTADVLPPPSKPMDVARMLVGSPHAPLPPYRHWRDAWMLWRGTHWTETDVASVRSWLYQRLEHAVYLEASKSGLLAEKPWAPTRSKIADLMEALAAVLHLDSAIDPPAWLSDDGLSTIAVPSFVACTNGLLDPASGVLYSHSPSYFNLVSVPFAWDPSAACPAWLAFLESCWPTDPESILCLQQWFGYVLSGSTSLHKILLIHGERRSGKGTIARILTALLGTGNVTGPTLASFGTNFGLSDLIRRPLAIIGDARIKQRDTEEVTERLLSISGEDVLTVDRKYQAPWVGKLPTRLMILSNELPNFGDSSGTVVSRFVTLTMAVSWLGREDTSLSGRLLGELPGILNWALEGLRSLSASGRLLEPMSSAGAMADLADSVSPMSVFVRDCCELAPGLESKPYDVYLRWRSWCLANGRSERQIGTVQSFGRQLRSVLPGLGMHRTNAGDRTYLGLAVRQVDLAQLLISGNGTNGTN